MKECSQKQFERCEELAVLSGRIAKKVGAKEELTYVAALYCDMSKILQNDITVTSEELARENDFPEELIKIIQEQTEKDALPSSMESAIVLITNNIITMYHFIMKNKKDVSMSKLIENTFQMHLKKGTIRSAGMSMSQYHKIRQEFYSEFKETYHIE
jgi:membrane-associated HD superfamily phosphohydrolase